MASFDYWDGLLRRQARGGPFRFVNGMCHVLEKGLHYPLHAHPFLEVVYHPSGRGTTGGMEGGAIAFREGDAVVYPPGAIHDQVMERAGEDWCVQIAVPLPRGAGVQARALHIPGIASAAMIEEIRALSRGHPALPGSPRRAVLDLRATTVLVELLQLVGERQATVELSVGERHVVAAESWIAERFGEIESLRQVADGIGVGYDHLRHLFKVHRGKSLVRHLNETRIGRAGVLLTHSRLSLKRIASLCGFRDEYYFSTVFRQFTGTAPGGYRGRDGGSGAGKKIRSAARPRR